MSRLSSLSSTRSILGILSSFPPPEAGRPRRGPARPPVSAHVLRDQVVDDADELGAAVGALLQHLLGVPVQPGGLLAAEVLGGDDHDRERPPRLLAPHRPPPPAAPQ